jgi:exo-beta-1,3-glucanase (GH17 family)
MCTQQAPAAGASVAAASTADSSGLGGLTAGLQKQIDSGAATLTTNISTQLETLTDKVRNFGIYPTALCSTLR